MRLSVLALSILGLCVFTAQTQAQSCTELVAQRDTGLSSLLAAQSAIPSDAEVLTLQREVSDTVSALELAKRTMENAIPNFANEVGEFDQMVMSFIDSDQAEEVLKAQIDDAVEELRSAAYQLIEIRRAEAAVRTMNDQLVERVTAYNDKVTTYNDLAQAFQELQGRLQTECGITPVVSFADKTQGT